MTAPTARRATISYRLGDTWAPALPEREALARDGRPSSPRRSAKRRAPRTDGDAGPPGAVGPRGGRSAASRGAGRRRRVMSTEQRSNWRWSDDRPRRRRTSSSPAAPARSAPPSSTSCSTPAPPTSSSSTTSSAAGGQPRRRRSRSGRVTLVEGDIRDRDLVDDLTAGKDVVFHQAAIRITQCAEEPRLALEVLVDGTFNVVEAAAEARVSASSSPRRRRRSTAWPRSSRPRAPPPPQQRHVLRRGQDVQRGHAPQLPRHVRARLRRAALLQRLRPAHGRPRPLHRGAGPLDGAHRRRQAAADLRRRPADDGLRLHPRHRPRQHPRRPRATSSTGVYNIASGTETSLLELAEALLRVMGSDLGVEHGPERAVNGVTRRLADTARRRARPRLRGDDRPRRGPARARRVVGAAARGDRRPGAAVVTR